MALERAAGGAVFPAGDGEERLEGADGGPGLQRDRLDALARQVGQQRPAVVVEVRGGAVLEETRPEPPQIRRERWPQLPDLLVGHRVAHTATPS